MTEILSRKEIDERLAWIANDREWGAIVHMQERQALLTAKQLVDALDTLCDRCVGNDGDLPLLPCATCPIHENLSGGE